ncbi:MAG TPA: sugar phosphate nucleotidyltransferase [Candidatus Binatia bacterium]|nr:sugar phosphate nucleotidyltransferase [Candidatus Binatia bacterium]
MRLHPVILAGGRGERFWPLSRRARPKQLLPLLSERSMLADTLARLRGAALPRDTFVITARDLAGAVRDAVPEIPHHHVVGEPVGKNTAPAVALAAWWLRDAGEDAVVAVLPSDHRVEPAERFREELVRAGEAALERGAIVTFCMPPTRPETGYGYIEVGAATAPGSPLATVAAFREKPDLATASRYASDGRHLWNAGMFLFPPGVMLEEIRAHAPEIAELLPALPARLAEDEAALLRYYGAAPSVSIDVAVMERSARALVARAGFAWDDLGSWAALGQGEAAEGSGSNVTRGRTILLDSDGVVAFADGGLVAAVGARDLVIVHTPDATLVCPKDRVQEVRALVARLKAEPGGDAFL